MTLSNMTRRFALVAAVGGCALAGCAAPGEQDEVDTAVEGVTRAGATRYFHYTDHLGSVIATTTANDSIHCRADYRPFGGDHGSTCAERKYNGNIQDDTGLYYYGARYYDPRTARFASADPARGQLEVVQSQNRYAYVMNNPYRYVDPSGNVALSTVGRWMQNTGDVVGVAGLVVPGADTVGDIMSTVGSVLQGDWTGAAIGAASIIVPVATAGMLRRGGSAALEHVTAFSRLSDRKVTVVAEADPVRRAQIVQDSLDLPAGDADALLVAHGTGDGKFGVDIAGKGKVVDPKHIGEVLDATVSETAKVRGYVCYGVRCLPNLPPSQRRFEGVEGAISQTNPPLEFGPPGNGPSVREPVWTPMGKR